MGVCASVCVCVCVCLSVCLSVCLPDFSHLSRCILVSPVRFICIFLVANDVEHWCPCVLWHAYVILIEIRTAHFTTVFCLHFVEFGGSFYKILPTNHVANILFANIFFQAVSCSVLQ